MRLASGLFAIAFNALVVSVTFASDVSRVPPPVYAEHLATQLTSLDQVLPGRTVFPETKSGGINLLAEKIVYRGPEGPTYRLSHLVYHALDQSGVESVGADTFVFDREREEIFLIDAATILPNGTRLPVEPSGAFIQTPQREADNSLYTSKAELRVIYPNVTPGTTTEVIVLIRENVPVIPGEFAMIATYGASWPTYRDRVVLDFPAAEMARVHIVATGSGVPEPTTLAYAPGRERRSWEASRVAEVAWEEKGPRWEFRGPTLWLTTLDSWDGLSRWYQSLVTDRAALGAELSAEVDNWTTGLTEPRAIIDRLTAIVSTDVRYVGLEFGLAGYQPHPCREVWEKRYGDCKDKANLLRAMLAHKGIRSHLVLLDTRAMGRIERPSPSWLQFNHVILAVENGEAGYLFCDPTIERLPAGSIGMSDLSREVLIVKESQAEWVRTPDLLASGIRIQADLALAADGGLSGWLTFGATGSDAAYYASYFNGLDRDDRRRKMHEYVGEFFPGAETIDIDFSPPGNAVKEMSIRAYLLRAPRAAEEQVIQFPYPKDWLPSTTTAGERRFPYAASRREETIDVSISLPENWSVRTAPNEFSANSDVAKFTALWSVQPRKLDAQMSWHPQHAVLSPSEYPVFQRSIRALSGWLDQPVILAFSKEAVAAPNPPTADAIDLSNFPILPTGAGQLRLLEEKFPEGKSDTERRAALQRVVQWFAQDQETVFTAQVQLAMLDTDRDGEKVFADRTRALLARHGTQLSAGTRTWGEYLEAKARWTAEKDPTAIKRLQLIADDVSLSSYRRGWSAEAAGRFLRETDPKAAKSFLMRHAGYDSEARETIVRLIFAIFANDADDTGVLSWSLDFAKSYPSVADTLLATALQEIDGDRISTKTRLSLTRRLKKGFGDKSGFPNLIKQLEKLETLNAADAACGAYREQLATWLRKNPPTWWTPKKSAEFADATAVIKYIRDKNKDETAQSAVDGVLQLILFHEPKFADLAVYSRWGLWWLNKQGFANELLEAWGRATLLLPPEHEDVIDCWNILGTRLAQKNAAVEARSVLQRVNGDSAAAKYQRVEADGELGLMEMRLGNIDAALAAFHQIEPIHTGHKWSADYLYPAVLLHLQRGEFDDALALLASIQKEEQQYLDKCDHHQALGHLLRAAQHPVELKRYWQRQQKFQSAWNGLLASQDLMPTPPNKPPLPTDYTALADRLAKAIAAKDAEVFIGELDMFARLAQWIPLFSSDLITYSTKADVFSVQLQNRLYECSLLLITDFEPVDPEFESVATVWEIALLGDTGKHAEARAKARLAVKKFGLDNLTGQKALRIWAMFARKTEDEREVTAMLATELETKKDLPERMHSLRILSDSYQLSGNNAANRALLERETARSDFDPKSEYGRVLAARLNLLRTSGESAQTFTREVKAWMSRRDLGWLEHVAPDTIEDPRFAALKAPVMQEPQGFSTAETIKFNLLTATDERISAEIRGQSLYAAAFDIAFAADDVREFAATFAEAAAIETMPADSRANCVSVVLNSLLRMGRTDLAAEIAAQPAFKILREELRADYERCHRALLRADEGGEKWEIEAFAILTEKPLDRFSLGVAERIVRQLGIHGEIDRAQQLIANAKDMAINVGVGQTSSGLRLEWARLMRNIRDHAKLLGTLRSMLDAVPEATSARTPRVVNWLPANKATGLTDDERVATAALVLDRGTMLPENTSQVLWILSSSRRFVAQHPMFFPDLLDATIHSNAPDIVKSTFVSGSALGGDIDRPEVLARVSKLLEDFARSPAASSLPQTRQAVQAARAVHAFRTSREKKPDVLFDPAQTGSLSNSFRAAIQLRFHHSRGHIAEALQLVETLGVDDLTKPEVFAVARSILMADGRATEVELLDESMRAVLKQRMPTFWFSPDAAGTENWFDAVQALGSPEAFPASWFDRAVAGTASTSRQNSLRLRQAWLTQDWADMRTSADALLLEIPDMYDAYYPRALVRHRMHDDAGARDDLKVFLEHALNSEYYQSAVALYNELAPGERLKLPE